MKDVFVIQRSDLDFEPIKANERAAPSSLKNHFLEQLEEYEECAPGQEFVVYPYNDPSTGQKRAFHLLRRQADQINIAEGEVEGDTVEGGFLSFGDLRDLIASEEERQRLLRKFL